jgi:EAL domain-containing protein (putative c-di-GMP-specific phosphodiesterase class I)
VPGSNKAFPPSLAVNLSAQEFRQRDVVKEVTQALADTGLDACYLHIEVTETTLMLSGNQMQRCMPSRPWASGLAIDDFGTGYSSLPICASTP